jgi:ATP-dependent Clp protease protease subunit
LRPLARFTGRRKPDQIAGPTAPCRPALRGEPMMNDPETPEEVTELLEAGAASMFLRLLKTRTILISGPIDKAVADKVMRQLLILDQESEEPILVVVNSPGGDADAGLAIFDMLRFVKSPVRTLAAGLAASAAALIMLAADKGHRYSLPNARFLIHQPIGGVGGTAIDIAIQAEAVMRLKKRLNELISTETGQPLDKVEEDTDRDYWMNADEAREYGIIQHIITRRSEIR